MNVFEKKIRMAELKKQQRKMLDKLDAEKRTFTDEERSQFDKLDPEIDQLEKDILEGEADLERRRKVAEREFGMRGNRKGSGDHNPDVNPEKEFTNIAEYLHAIARFKSDGIKDARLDTLYEQREQTMGTGATGGYALPEQFDSTLRQVQAQEGIVRSRSTVIPAGTPPDARFIFPTLDQTSGSNNYGGVTVVHTGEGITMTETGFALREASLEPKEISAYIVVTNKLLNNWEAAGTFVTRQLSMAMIGQEDYDFMQGNGVNKALGFINCAAQIAYSRAAGNLIDFPDICGMLAKILMRSGGGSYVWLASQTTIPELASMVDAGGHAVWLGGRGVGLEGAQGPLPSTLLGMPVLFGDRLPALGTKGDLSLVNLAYYLIKDGSGPAAASSEHILFLSNKTVFKIVWNVDGHPWLTEPLALEGSTANKVSPFVVLE